MNSLAEESGIASQRFFPPPPRKKSRATLHEIPLFTSKRQDIPTGTGTHPTGSCWKFSGEKTRNYKFSNKGRLTLWEIAIFRKRKKNPRGIGSKCISGALCNWVFTRGGWKQCRSDAQGLNGSNSRETRGSITEGSEVRFFSRRGCGMGEEIGRGATCWNRSGMKWEWFL